MASRVFPANKVLALNLRVVTFGMLKKEVSIAFKPNRLMTRYKNTGSVTMQKTAMLKRNTFSLTFLWASMYIDEKSTNNGTRKYAALAF